MKALVVSLVAFGCAATSAPRPEYGKGSGGPARRRIDSIGVTFRTRNAAEVERIVDLTRESPWPALSTGAPRLPIDKVYPLDSAPEALQRMRRNAHFGKIVLSGRSSDGRGTNARAAA